MSAETCNRCGRHADPFATDHAETTCPSPGSRSCAHVARERPLHTLALTLIQPWATLIIAGHKPIENRTWAPDSRLRPGDRLWIHGGKSWDEDAVDLARCILRPAPDLSDAPRGFLLGHVRYEGVCHASPSPWFFGPVGWRLSDPVSLAVPVPCRGAQGLWRVPTDALARAREVLR